MTVDTIHEQLIRANLVAPIGVEDGLLWMALLHTHGIQLREALLSDRPDVIGLAAITERDAADVLAAVCRDCGSSTLASSTFWYWEYQKAPYQCVEDVPPVKLRRLQQLRGQLAADPRIAGIIPEDQR